MTDSTKHCSNCGPGGGGGNCTCTQKGCEHEWQVDGFFMDTKYLEEINSTGSPIEYYVPSVRLICTKCFNHKTVESKEISNQN